MYDKMADNQRNVGNIGPREGETNRVESSKLDIRLDQVGDECDQSTRAVKYRREGEKINTGLGKLKEDLRIDGSALDDDVYRPLVYSDAQVQLDHEHIQVRVTHWDGRRPTEFGLLHSCMALPDAVCNERWQ